MKWAGAGAAAALMLIGAGVWARSAPATHHAAAAHSTSRGLTMDQAVRTVERRYHARVVRAEAVRRCGRTVYVLRLLDPAGRVFTVRVAAMSGRIW